MSKHRYIMTIDVGSGSGRVSLFNEDGDLTSFAQREWAPIKIHNFPDAMSFDTDKGWELLVECIKESLYKANVKPHEVAGITATSMREGMVLYDANKKVIWACPNADARASKEVEDMLNAGLGEIIYKIGGDWLNIISPPRFWWIKSNQPDLYERISYMSMLSDWVLFKLCGEIVTEITCGSSSGIFDLKNRTWSSELIKITKLPENIYPKVCEPGTIIGKVTKEAAYFTGLREGTPVITGGGDTQMALVGVGAISPGSFTIIGGSFWQTTVITSWPLIDPKFRLRTLCHALPKQWMVEGVGFYHGFTMRWFRDGFCEEEKIKSKKKKLDTYYLMEEIAKKIPPGSNGVNAIFSNIMNARKWKHAVPSFVGFNILSPEKTGKAACIRAIEEGAAYTSRAHFEILKELSGYDPEVVVFCGGSSKGELWPQILADVLGKVIKIPVIKEATSLGSAICASVALGWFNETKEAIEKLVRWEREITPIENNTEAYSNYYRLWLKIYPYLVSIADDGLLPPLWKAPGL